MSGLAQGTSLYISEQDALQELADTERECSWRQTAKIKYRAESQINEGVALDIAEANGGIRADREHWRIASLV